MGSSHRRSGTLERSGPSVLAGKISYMIIIIRATKCTGAVDRGTSMKRIKLFAAVLAGTISLAACGGADLASHVTVDGILALRRGMSYEQVISKIGEPFEME